MLVISDWRFGNWKLDVVIPIRGLMRVDLPLPLAKC